MVHARPRLPLGLRGIDRRLTEAPSTHDVCELTELRRGLGGLASELRHMQTGFERFTLREFRRYRIETVRDALEKRCAVDKRGGVVAVESVVRSD